MDVEGVLLCAGVGVRLRPLTETIPKALVPVAGRPIVDYHLEAWHAAGLRRAILVIGYRGDQVRRHVAACANFGLEVDYAVQADRRGTGHALLAAEERTRAETILVGYCDVFFGRAPLIWTALLSDRRAKIVGATVPNASRYGRLLTGGDPARPQLVAIHEKDGISSPGLVNAGAYLLPRRVFELLHRVPVSPRGEIELTDGVAALVTTGSAVDVVPTALWVDVGTVEHLAVADRVARA